MRAFVTTTKWDKMQNMRAVYKEVIRHCPIDRTKYAKTMGIGELLLRMVDVAEFIYIMQHVNTTTRLYMLGVIVDSNSRHKIRGVELFSITDDPTFSGYSFEYMVSVLTHNGMTQAIKSGANPSCFKRTLDTSSYGVLPYRVQRNVIQFLCICRVLPTRLNRDVCMRIVRSYLHTESLYMQALYMAMMMPVNDLRLQWGGGKRLGRSRMATELADVQSTRALFYGCSNFGDVGMDQQERSPAERLRNAWVLGNYAECATELGLVKIGNDLSFLFRELAQEPGKWKTLYDACGPSNMPLQSIMKPMESATRDFYYEPAPYKSRKKLVSAMLFLAQVAFKRNEWHLLAKGYMFFYNIRHLPELAQFATERGAAWHIEIGSTEQNIIWLDRWNRWCSREFVSGWYTLAFRAQAAVVMYMFQCHPELGQTVARYMARAIYIHNVQGADPDPTCKWTRAMCIDYMKRFGMRVDKTKGVLGLQNDAHELKCAVQLYSTH